MKVCTVLGARPQFVKAAVVSRAFLELKKQDPFFKIDEVIIHTGQHFDSNMSDVFFSEMDIPKPKYNLNTHSLTHGAMTGQMLEKIEKILLEEKPDMVLIYGDTNSTLAGAIAAVKLHIPIAHVEAGMRSFNRKMPEEINRILSDHCTDLFFTSCKTASENLVCEGIPKHKIDQAGDVMYDAFFFYLSRSQAKKHSLLESLRLVPKEFVLTTLHRAQNTDDPEILKEIVDALIEIGKEKKVVLPLHPRTAGALTKANLFSEVKKNLCLIPPVGYFDMLELEQNAAVILTDSGGVQKEAYFAKVPCITLREETEWVELVELGVNALTGSCKEKILKYYSSFTNQEQDFSAKPYGDGLAGQKIAASIGGFIAAKEKEPAL